MSLQIIPSIDLRDGRVVRLKQGDYAQQLNYDFDPIETARRFEAAGAAWMHIVDLDGAKEGRPAQTTLLGQIIAATNLQVQVGGGVRSTEDVQQLLDLGARRVVVGTAAMEKWDWFEWLVKDTAFQNRITLALDARDGVVATRGWTASSGKRAIDVAREVSDWPIASILYTDVAKDGMMQGPNVEQTEALAKAGRVPVIASGGVKDLSHIKDLLGRGIWGVIVGRSLHEGTLNLVEAVQMGQPAE